MSVYSNPTAEMRRLQAELRFELDKAKVERKYAFAWGFGFGAVFTLSLTVLLSL